MAQSFLQLVMHNYKMMNGRSFIFICMRGAYSVTQTHTVNQPSAYAYGILINNIHMIYNCLTRRCIRNNSIHRRKQWQTRTYVEGSNVTASQTLKCEFLGKYPRNPRQHRQFTKNPKLILMNITKGGIFWCSRFDTIYSAKNLMWFSQASRRQIEAKDSYWKSYTRVTTCDLAAKGPLFSKLLERKH